MDSSTDDRSITSRNLWVGTLRRDLMKGQPVRLPSTPFLVRRARREVGQNAGTYVKCELGDQTGWIDAVWWEASRLGDQSLEQLMAAPVWAVEGTASLHRYGGRETPQVRMEKASPVAGADPLEIPGLVRRSASTEEELGAWLSATIAQLQNQPLKLLLEDTLGEGGSWHASYLRAPAALFYHHAYIGGLVDHVREMVSLGLASLATFEKVDRDLTLAGVLLHDVGKLDTFSSDPVPQIARAGRYVDHITAGIARLSRAMEDHSNFPAGLREHLLHIVASHHGEKEHGSPVIPATREAIVVHHLDRLSSLLSHFEEWGRQSPVDQFGWSTDPSPWLKVPLASSTVIPDSFEDGDPEQ